MWFSLALCPSRSATVEDQLTDYFILLVGSFSPVLDLFYTFWGDSFWKKENGIPNEKRVEQPGEKIGTRWWG